MRRLWRLRHPRPPQGRQHGGRPGLGDETCQGSAVSCRFRWDMFAFRGEVLMPFRLVEVE